MKRALCLTITLLTFSLLACQCNSCSNRGMCTQVFEDGSAECHINMELEQCKRPTEKPRKSHFWVRQTHRTAIPKCESMGYKYKGKIPIKKAIRQALQNQTHITLHRPAPKK